MIRHGGLVHRFSIGGQVPGTGKGDKVRALLEPGEFVVREPVARQYGGFLRYLNEEGDIDGRNRNIIGISAGALGTYGSNGRNGNKDQEITTSEAFDRGWLDNRRMGNQGEGRGLVDQSRRVVIQPILQKGGINDDRNWNSGRFGIGDFFDMVIHKTRDYDLGRSGRNLQRRTWNTDEKISQRLGRIEDQKDSQKGGIDDADWRTTNRYGASGNVLGSVLYDSRNRNRTTADRVQNRINGTLQVHPSRRGVAPDNYSEDRLLFAPIKDTIAFLQGVALRNNRDSGGRNDKERMDLSTWETAIAMSKHSFRDSSPLQQQRYLDKTSVRPRMSQEQRMHSSLASPGNVLGTLMGNGRQAAEDPTLTFGEGGQKENIDEELRKEE